jgi:ABC-type branched-subunit amino acid transport system substrate-binding protein
MVVPLTLPATSSRFADVPISLNSYMDANIGGADFWRLSNKLARGMIGYSAYAANDPRQMVQDWVRLWREKTGRQSDAPDGFVTVYFDAVIVLAHVLNTATDLSREAIRDSFSKVSRARQRGSRG